MVALILQEFDMVIRDHWTKGHESEALILFTPMVKAWIETFLKDEPPRPMDIRVHRCEGCACEKGGHFHGRAKVG
jgi:streptogramin lyase